MKTIDDYLDDIEDVLSQEGECVHRASHEEDGIYDSVERSLSARGRSQVWRILFQFQQDVQDLVMDIVSKVAEEKDEKERNMVEESFSEPIMDEEKLAERLVNLSLSIAEQSGDTQRFLKAKRFVEDNLTRQPMVVGGARVELKEEQCKS